MRRAPMPCACPAALASLVSRLLTTLRLVLALSLSVASLVHASTSAADRGVANPTQVDIAETLAPVGYTLDVTLDPEHRTLHGRVEILIRDGAAIELLLNSRFELTALAVEGVPMARKATRAGPYRRWQLPAGAAQRVVTAEWHGALTPTPQGQLHRDTLGGREPTADLRGSFLPAGSLWYPRAARDGVTLLHDYRASITLPAEQHGLVAGTRVSKTTIDGQRVVHFDFPQPAEGIDLMAGPYRVGERSTASIDGRAIVLRSYFHDEIEGLASGYLDAVGDYLALYEEWIGPYPFTTFSVVSSPTPTGFGMPTLTYLGIEVLRLPFIRDSSLGHEVLHNWWGNGVYPDYARGNWSEGLTTFMADYTYALRRSADAARAMRLGWLRALSAIPADADQPLAAFTARHHGVSQAVGYGKAAMLFVMLRERIGEAAFDRGVQRFWQRQRFRVAGWDDLRTAFEAESGEALQVFFDQWLARRGLPDLRLEAARRSGDGVLVTLSQSTPPYELDVPLRVETAQGVTTHVVPIEAAQQQIRLTLAGTPRRVTLDPDSALLRRLGRHEAPPILRELQLDPGTAVLTLGERAFRRAAQDLIGRLLDHRPAEHRADRAVGDTPLLVIGIEEEVTRWLARHALPSPPPEVAGRGDTRMWTLRLPTGTPVAVIAARDGAALERATRPLPHYGQQSWLVIDDGRAREHGVWPAQAPSIEVTRD